MILYIFYVFLSKKYVFVECYIKNALKILSLTACATSNSLWSGNMRIEVRFPDDSLSSNQKAVFYEAADRWGKVIQGTPKLPFDYKVEISASSEYIDTVGGVRTSWPDTPMVQLRATYEGHHVF